MKLVVAAALAALSLAGPGAAMSQPLPDALKPRAMAGFGWYVHDLEAQKDWYMRTLGMRLVRTVEKNGKPYEYILGYDAGAMLALVPVANLPKGPNPRARLVLNVPDAKGLADHLKGQGIANRVVIENVAYFIADPEGNQVELYTPPAR